MQGDLKANTRLFPYDKFAFDTSRSISWQHRCVAITSADLQLSAQYEKMNKKTYSLCEAVADIAYIAATKNYEPEDSREKFFQFIEWAKDFEFLHRNIEWGVNSPFEYIDSIYHFTIFNLNQWSNK